jgi:hypothetical protein
VTATVEDLLGRLDAFRSIVKLAFEGQVVDWCPICDSPTFVDEHVPMSDCPQFSDFWVCCRGWEPKGGRCPFHYQVHQDRDEVKRACKKYGIKFLANDLAEEYHADNAKSE